MSESNSPIPPADLSAQIDRSAHAFANALEHAHAIGAQGAPHTQEERELFESYMRGHCWEAGEWIKEKSCYEQMSTRMLYDVWRGRGALQSSTPGAAAPMPASEDITPACLDTFTAAAATPTPAAAHVPAFLLVAYRWGWVNNAPRTMALTTDFDQAVDMADEEAADTGGKYGVAVYEWTSQDEYRLAHYAASAHGEVAPFVNRRIELFRSIGQAAHEVVTTAGAFLPGDAIPSSAHPKAGESQFFWSKPQDVPEWLELLVIREARQSEFMKRVQDEIRSRKEQNLAPATSDDYGRIFEESSEPIVTLIEQRKRDSKSHWEQLTVEKTALAAPTIHP